MGVVRCSGVATRSKRSIAKREIVKDVKAKLRYIALAFRHRNVGRLESSDKEKISKLLPQPP